MFDQFQVQKPGEQKPNHTRALKLLSISCCLLILGGGLCGLDTHFYPKAEFGGPLGGLGALFIVISVLLLLGIFLWVIARSIDKLFKR